MSFELEKAPKKRELTEKQEIFLNKLFDNGGNIAKSLKEAGYSENSRKWLVKSLQREIIDRCESYLAINGAKAVTRLSEAMDDEGNIPRAEMRIKAAESILNRIGLGKKESIHHNVKAIPGIVVLPPKKE